MTDILNDLFSMKDENYKNFHSKLIPMVNPDTIIGVRTPALRKYAKDVFKTPAANEFLQSFPHKYYEENNLHAFIIESIKDYDTALCETERFLPFIDNWATCDMFLPKVFKNNKTLLLPKIKEWIKSSETYTVRYAIGLLLKLYIDESFDAEMLTLVASVKSDEYYINMMIAWYFATALAKQYEKTVSYIENRCLDIWIHNKTIQKAVESNRISPETKKYLKTFKFSI